MLKLKVIARTDKVGSEVKKIIEFDEEDYYSLSQEEIEEIIIETLLNEALYNLDIESIDGKKVKVTLSTPYIGSEMTRIVDCDSTDIIVIEKKGLELFNEMKDIEFELKD